MLGAAAGSVSEDQLADWFKKNSLVKQSIKQNFFTVYRPTRLQNSGLAEKITDVINYTVEFWITH